MDGITEEKRNQNTNDWEGAKMKEGERKRKGSDEGKEREEEWGRREETRTPSPLPPPPPPPPSFPKTHAIPQALISSPYPERHSEETQSSGIGKTGDNGETGR